MYPKGRFLFNGVNMNHMIAELVAFLAARFVIKHVRVSVRIKINCH